MNSNQIIKDYSSIVIARQSALKATQSVVETYKIKISVKQYFQLVERFYKFIETGDYSWCEGMDKFFKLEQNKNFEEIFGEDGKKI